MQLAWLRLSRQRVINQQDGFTFGNERSIYNPWSITSFLNERSLAPYWVNTSSNGLVSSLVRRGDEDLKADFETLLEGGSLRKRIDQAVSFESLYASPAATWSLLLATGYLRVAGRGERYDELDLKLTNREVREGFYGMVRDWFEPAALLQRLCARTARRRRRRDGGVSRRPCGRRHVVVRLEREALAHPARAVLARL